MHVRERRHDSFYLNHLMIKLQDNAKKTEHGKETDSKYDRDVSKGGMLKINVSR